MAIKKELLGDNPMFLFLFFLFCWVLEVIATVITSPYQFLFRFCAKSSLWLRVSFIWGICNPVSVFGTSREKSPKITRTSFWAANLRASSPGNYGTFISSKFFELRSVTIFEKSIFTNCSVLTDSCTILHLPLFAHLFEFSWSKNLIEVVLQYLMLITCFSYAILNFVDWDYYYYCTNAANENCDEFCVKEVFKCRERRMMQ